MLIAELALRDLIRDRFFLFCNVAVMVGILVPLLVLFGVKNGVYSALIGDMLADPANLQIDTAGNATLGEAEIALLTRWIAVADSAQRRGCRLQPGRGVGQCRLPGPGQIRHRKSDDLSQ